RRQSDHFADYQAVLENLRARGLLYRCFRTRREIADSLPPGADPEEAAFTGRPLPAAEEEDRIARGHPFAWRLSLAAARDALGSRYDRLAYVDESSGTARAVKAEPARFGDVVLARKDTPASYHLA